MAEPRMGDEVHDTLADRVGTVTDVMSDGTYVLHVGNFEWKAQDPARLVVTKTAGRPSRPAT